MVAAEDITVLREIADGAKVSPDARIGPCCVIGPEVVIGPGTVLKRRVTVTGRTIIGQDNVIGDGCVLGAVPQDLKYRGGPTWLIIGDRNCLGPNVTAHVGTEAGGCLTRIGNDNVLECGAHVAHDCYVDDRTRLATGVLLAGHIRVETGAVIEELTGAHHFTTIGQFSLVGTRTPVRRDVPPFAFYSSLGYYNTLPIVQGPHEGGLERAGFSPQEKEAVRQAIARLFRDEQALKTKIDRLLRQRDLPQPVKDLCQFCLRSLGGLFGRQRESFRGQMPPEARQHLPKEFLAQIEGARRP